jgi:signal transduction histidine kinase
MRQTGANGSFMPRPSSNDDLLRDVARRSTVIELMNLVAHDLGHRAFHLCASTSDLASQIKKLEGLSSRSRLLEAAESIVHDAARISEMLASIRSLQFDREPRETRFKIHQAVKRIALNFAPVFESRRINFTINVAADLELVGPEEVFSQVIANLILNSIDAITGNPRQIDRTISVFSKTRRSSARSVEIIVSDSGPGISPEIKESETIFKIGVTSRLGRTGVGLSVARSLVEQYFNGTLTLLSTRPAAFRLDVPRKRVI